MVVRLKVNEKSLTAKNRQLWWVNQWSSKYFRWGYQENDCWSCVVEGFCVRMVVYMETLVSLNNPECAEVVFEDCCCNVEAIVHTSILDPSGVPVWTGRLCALKQFHLNGKGVKDNWYDILTKHKEFERKFFISIKYELIRESWFRLLTSFHRLWWWTKC